MQVNGAAARLVHHGDTIIVISYGAYDEADLERYEPRVVHVDARTNRIIAVDDEVATPARVSASTESERNHRMSSTLHTTGARRPPSACR